MSYKKIAFNTFFQLLSRSFTTLANFIIVLLIAKSLGSFGLGEYNKVFTFIGIFSLFIDFGINAVYLKSNQLTKQFYTLIILRLLLAGIIFLIIQPILFILPYNTVSHVGFSVPDKMYIEVISLLLFIYSFSQSLQALYQIKERFDLLIYPNIVLSLSILSFGVLGFFSHSLLWFFWGTIIGWIFYVIIGYVVIKKTINLDFSIDFSYLKVLFKQSLPLGATLFLNVLYVRADTLILSFVKSTADVGIYTLAYKFFEFPLTLSFFIMNALYPLFLQTREKGEKEFADLIKKWFFIFLIGSLILVVIAFVASPLLQFVKHDFIASIMPFRLLILSYPIFFISNLFMWIIITKNKERKLPIVYIVSLLTNVVLNVIFIPKYGYNAAAIITGISEIVVLILLGIISFQKSD